MQNVPISPFTEGVKPEKLLKQLHSFEGRIAEFISNFAGSMNFVYFHVIWFSLWIAFNHGLFESLFPAFDPFPYGLLTMIVSLEAIFLATFIMINQNRQALIETYRELEEEKAEEEAEEEVEDIQKDLEDIKKAMSFIQQKLTNVQKAKNGSSTPSTPPPSSASSL